MAPSLPSHAYLTPVWAPNLFRNKVLFCTGGAGSICSAQVRAFVHLGGNACIIGRNPEKTASVAADIAAQSGRADAKVIGMGSVDVRRSADLQAAVDRCVEELGSLDFCIAGAAGNFLASQVQLSENAFRSVVEIDLLGSFNTFKACLPHLRDSAARNRTDGTGDGVSTGGRIIFVSATLHYTGTPFQTHVAAAKAGVDALSAHIAIEQGPFGITSNIIAPGPIRGTEGVDRLITGGEEGMKSAGKRIPSGRMGTVREIADATVYLFSAAGNYVNGTGIIVDGGAWRIQGTLGSGADMQYPDFLLAGSEVTGVKGMKKSKI